MCVCAYMIYYKELAHAVMEAEKSRDLQLASWRPARVNGVNPSLSLSPKADQRLSQLKQLGREQILSYFTFLFCSGL